MTYIFWVICLIAAVVFMGGGDIDSNGSHGDGYE